ncbi:cobalamin B12-binding domain-containing protein [Thiocapsa bogorovii]|uniref:cobalamin B12-binding domain-containing protein n=1 Tax=Thiocapsa bogorovii TaxID=521689 RepID=UPI001E4D0F37|nr:cobalamin-dependent protein [Thiocapsa bogorovii]UHD14261.1 cobalamin-dependent protein [Thiocapsa bogorovii]
MTITSNDPVETFLNALLAMDRVAAKRALGDPASADVRLDVVERLVVPSLERIGDLWERGEVSLSQVYMSGRMCEEMVDAILPPSDPARVDQPPMAIAVLDDYHLLGKRMVYSVLRASGYELKDYGTVDADALVGRVVRDGIVVLLISVLMLPSALHIKKVREALGRAGSHPFILVGGAPFRFDTELWREVGADAMAGTAAEGVAVVREHLEKRAQEHRA